MIGILLAAQLAAVAHVADSVGACEPLELSVAVSAPGTALPRLVVPSFAPFDVMRSAALPQVARDSRAVPSMMVEYQYTLVADEPGHYTIPPFEARVGASTVRTEPLHVVVTGTTGGGEPAVFTRARIDTGSPGGYRAAPDTVYVGQQSDYTVAVFLNSAMRTRLRHNPTFYPPDMQSVLAYDLPGGATNQRSLSTSRCFDALVYRRALFPLQAGRIVIPPAQLTYSLPVGASFFSREESHELQTDSAVVVAVEPPAAGRPADYAGAVGSFRLDARLQSSTARVGDPLTLTVRVSGSGNVKLLPRPPLAVPWASAVATDARVQVDSSGRRIGGIKEFDWILTPRVAGELDVPPVRYAYFDPYARRYRVATSAAAHVRVDAGTLAAVDSSPPRNVLPLRLTYRGPLGAPLSSYPIFWLALALAPLPALGARWRGRKRRGAARAMPPAASLEQVARAPAAAHDGPALRRAFVSALSDRLRLDTGAFTDPGALRRALRRSGVSTEAAADAEALLGELDAAAFSAAGALSAGAADRALALARRVDAEALPRHELPFRTAVLVALVALGIGGSLRALSRDVAADAFGAGVTAYQQHDYRAARDAFARVVADQPRAADGWANLGTAAWAAGDTVYAVAGWRHALGLEPLAADARDRLSLVHGVRALSPGYVPPVPLDVALILLALCWVAACVAWHPALRRRRPALASWTAPLVVAAAVAGLSAIAIGGRITAHGISVVRGNTAVSDDPVLGSDTGPSVGVGEMVRVLNRQGAWARVELDGGRQGWLPVQQLVALDAPLPPALD